ncbi:MAG: hypothetical protein OXF06_00965 [Bacteroidetes bacterium]|nr:hypothetical protein [Bacteroidota bacterium]
MEKGRGAGTRRGPSHDRNRLLFRGGSRTKLHRVLRMVHPRQATGGGTEERTEAIRAVTNIIESQLTPAQIEEAQQRATELQIEANMAQRDQPN